MLCEISCTIFGVHCSNRASEEIQKSTSIHYGSWKEIFLKSVLTRLSYIKFNKIYVRYSDAQQNNLLRKWVYIAENMRVLRCTKVPQYIMVYGGRLFKISLIGLFIKFTYFTGMLSRIACLENGYTLISCACKGAYKRIMVYYGQ